MKRSYMKKGVQRLLSATMATMMMFGTVVPVMAQTVTESEENVIVELTTQASWEEVPKTAGYGIPKNMLEVEEIEKDYDIIDTTAEGANEGTYPMPDPVPATGDGIDTTSIDTLKDDALVLINKMIQGVNIHESVYVEELKTALKMSEEDDSAVSTKKTELERLLGTPVYNNTELGALLTERLELADRVNAGQEKYTTASFSAYDTKYQSVTEGVTDADLVTAIKDLQSAFGELVAGKYVDQVNYTLTKEGIEYINTYFFVYPKSMYKLNVKALEGSMEPKETERGYKFELIEIVEGEFFKKHQQEAIEVEVRLDLSEVTKELLTKDGVNLSELDSSEMVVDLSSWILTNKGMKSFTELVENIKYKGKDLMDIMESPEELRLVAIQEELTVEVLQDSVLNGFLEVKLVDKSDQTHINLNYMVERYGKLEPISKAIKELPENKDLKIKDNDLLPVEKIYLEEYLTVSNKIVVEDIETLKDIFRFNKDTDFQEYLSLFAVLDKVGEDGTIYDLVEIEGKDAYNITLVLENYEEDLTPAESVALKNLRTPMKQLEGLVVGVDGKEGSILDMTEYFNEIKPLFQKGSVELEILPKHISVEVQRDFKAIEEQMKRFVQVYNILNGTKNDKGELVKLTPRQKADALKELGDKIVYRVDMVDEEGNPVVDEDGVQGREEVELEMMIRTNTIKDFYLENEFINEILKFESEQWLQDEDSDGRLDIFLEELEKDISKNYTETIEMEKQLQIEVKKLEEHLSTFITENGYGKEVNTEDLWKDYGKVEEEEVVEELPGNIIWKTNGFDVLEFDKIVEGMGVKFDKKKANLTFDYFNKEKYVAIVSIEDSITGKELVTEKSTNGEAIKIPVEEKTEVVSVKLVLKKQHDGKTGVEVKETIKEFTAADKVKPVLNYAYVIEEGLVVNITDDSGLDKDEPIVYRFGNKGKFEDLDENFGYGKKIGKEKKDKDKDKDNEDKYEGLFGKITKDSFDANKRLSPNDYRIQLDEIPTDVQVVAKDIYGNVLAIEIEVEEDNEVLSKNAPKEIIDLIEDYEGDKYSNRALDDLITVEVDKEVDFIDSFEKIIEDEFKSANSRDIKFYNEEGEELKNKKKFKDPGMYRITILSSKDFGETTGWVSVTKDGKVIPNYKIVRDLEIEGKEFQPIQAVEVPIKDTVPMQLVAAYNNRYYQMTDTIAYEIAEDKKKDEEKKDDKKEEKKGDKKEDEGIRIVIVDLQKDETYRVDVKSKGGLLDGFEEDMLDEDIEGLFPEAGKGFVPEDSQGHWAEQYIFNMMDKGFMYGYEGEGFLPDNEISAKEVLVVIGRIGMKFPQIASAEVEAREYGNTGDWSKNVVEYTLNRLPNNIFAGMNLDSAITREDSAYAMANFFKIEDKGFHVNLSDLGSSAHASAVKKLVSTGAVSGLPDGTFRPTTTITRAEVARILDSLI